MSSDLLRRAATKLREHANNPALVHMPPPWRVVLTDSESFTGVAGCAGGAEDDHLPGVTCDDCVSIEAWMGPVANYIWTLHPPVALALAKLLLCEVVIAETGGDVHPGAIEIAREVLREPEETP